MNICHMKEGLVSIIIPVHNSEKYLEECINSAIKQTYPDIEIIAVYDNYPDNSLNILKKFSNKITIVTTKICNIASARNKGIEQARGEWIKFLDSDDVLYPNTVKELVSIGKNLRNKKNTILYSNFELIDYSGKIIQKALEKNFNDLDQFTFNSKLLFFNNIGQLSTSLIHRTTLESYGMFNEKFIIGEDSELLLRYCILHSCRLHLIPKFLVKRRRHQASITAIRKNTIPKEERSMLHENPVETVVCQLDQSIREKYETAVRMYQEEKKLVITELEKTKHNILQNRKKIKELSGLNDVTKRSSIRTSVNFLFNIFTESQKIKTQLNKENKELRKKMLESRKRLQEYHRLSFSD